MIKKIIENEILKIVLKDNGVRIILIILAGYCLFSFIYYVFGIDDYVEKKNTYKEAEELFLKKEYAEAVRILGEIPDFKDTDELTNEIFPIMLNEIDRFLSNGNTFFSDEYISVMKYNLTLSNEETALLQEREDELESLQEIQLVEEREKLKYTEPYEGMAESKIEYSSWGPPTEINKDVNYESLREDRRVMHYKWIKKDEHGRIIEIKSLMVKQGFVWGEPEISHYWVNN